MVSERESHYVQSLARGLSVITAFGPETVAVEHRHRGGLVSSHVSRVTREQARDELLPALLRAVTEIETDLSRTQ